MRIIVPVPPQLSDGVRCTRHALPGRLLGCALVAITHAPRSHASIAHGLGLVAFDATDARFIQCQRSYVVAQVCRCTREGGTYRQVTQPVRVLVAHRFCRGGLLLPSFSVGGDAITTADDDEADDDEDDEGDSWLLLTRPGTLAGVSGVCLGSGSLAGAMAKETIPPPLRILGYKRGSCSKLPRPGPSA